jgi:hypothetical protein
MFRVENISFLMIEQLSGDDVALICQSLGIRLG